MERIIVNHLLCDAITGQGFVRRGSAFFRIVGNEVLQVIKFQYERSLSSYSLDVGLFSLYDELQKSWFTSTGCIPRYPVVSFIGKRAVDIILSNPNQPMFSAYSPELQIQVLKETALNSLNCAQDQRTMIELINKLDKAAFGEIIWNDYQKFSPYLAIEDYKSAEEVILSILRQSHAGKPLTMEYIGRKRYEEYCERRQRDEQLLLDKLDLVRRANRDEIKAYLDKNYKENRINTKFIIR